ncbi:MAG TPA: cupredoxin domain-containing protein [Gaiellaceae bacterium]|nr:cupredoxin domain-containing protein [Gaiellaceae bacterium]
MKRSAVVLLAVVALAGCGGNGSGGGGYGGGGGGTTTAAPPAATGPKQTVSLVDYALQPKTIRLDKPGTYTLEATNNGQTEHALEIEGNGVEESTETLAPGASGTITVALEMGEYELYCPIDSHRDRGMSGSIDVAG